MASLVLAVRFVSFYSVLVRKLPSFENGLFFVGAVHCSIGRTKTNTYAPTVVQRCSEEQRKFALLTFFFVFRRFRLVLEHFFSSIPFWLLILSQSAVRFSE